MNSPLSDSELVASFLTGDPGSFDQLDQRYRDRLAFFLRRRALCQESEREDRVQQTMIQAYQQLQTLRDSDRFAPWLYRIAIRICIDENRKLGRQFVRGKFPLDLLTDDDMTTAGAIARDVDPALIVERYDDRNTLWDRARKELTEEEFEILWMYYVDDWSASQIHEQTKRPVGTIRVLLHRIRRKLATVLEDYHEKSMD